MTPSTLRVLSDAFLDSWQEPQKLHRDSAQLRIKMDAARRRIAKNLGVEPAELEFVGEIGFAFWSAISGLMENREEQTIVFSSIDRQIVHAFGREHQALGGETLVAPVNADGSVNLTPLIENLANSLVIWQATNRETGVEQVPPTFPKGARIFVDMTARFNTDSLPERWDVALWDSRSFGGPEGLGILAIRNGGAWRSPIPAMDNRRLFGSFSKPLLLASDNALEEWRENAEKNRSYMANLNTQARKLLVEQLPAAKIVGERNSMDPRNIAIGIPGAIAEEILRELEKEGFLVDAGSACGAGALSPSHVLDACGLEGLAHIRITLKPTHSQEDVDDLMENLKKAVESL